MARYFLSAHSHVCVTAGHAIFLDLKRDKYTALQPSDVRAVRSLIRGWRDPMDSSGDSERTADNGTDTVRALLREGLLTQDGSTGKEVTPVAIDPVTTTIDDVRGSFPAISFNDFWKFVRAWILTTIMLRVFSLERLVRRVQKRKVRNRGEMPSFDQHKAHRLMTVYFILRPNFFSAKDACLRDSLTFIEFFALYQMYPSWLFGVKMNPFMAHSWVQEGAMVLNDYIPHVTSFEPILAV